MYVIKELRAIRNSQLPIRIIEIDRTNRIKLARGLAKQHADSTFKVFWQHLEDHTVSYFFECERHIFLFEDIHGIHVEVHIWYEEQRDDQ